MMRIMFVDDEPHVLSGLRRILRPLRHEWEMEFFDQGGAALEKLSESPHDVIVSDMKMPGMDGVQLLSSIRRDFPDSIRIALSGETDSHMIYRCVKHAHLYVQKPCDADMLVAAVRRACALSDLLRNESLKAIVANMQSLPSLPEQYEKIMQELQSEEPCLQTIAKIIETDVAMSAKILQLVNSAFFGLTRELSSASEAAMYLGVDVIKSLAMTTGVFSQFEGESVDAATVRSIWNHSVRVGNLAKKIMQTQSRDRLLADYALMGGLLADVGQLVIAVNFPEQFLQIADEIKKSGVSEWDAERRVVGHSHTDVGAYLIGLWGLPNPVLECVAYHHTPSECAASEFTPLTAVHVATAIVDACGSDEPEGIDWDCVNRLGLNESLPEWMQLDSDTE